jgi:hypothetical protein
LHVRFFHVIICNVLVDATDADRPLIRPLRHWSSWQKTLVSPSSALGWDFCTWDFFTPLLGFRFTFFPPPQTKVTPLRL